MKSILTEYEDISIFSGKPKDHIHHLCFGNGLRKLSEEDGLVIPLTYDEHEDIHDGMTAGKLSKICGQLAWEKEYLLKDILVISNRTRDDLNSIVREEFRNRYGVSYL